MQLEYTITLQIPFDISSLRMHLESFAHEQNIPASHKYVPEYLECTQNSVRIFRMHFDCRRMHYEFSFRRHSGSFRHSCDCPFTDDVRDVEQVGTTQNFIVGHEVGPEQRLDLCRGPGDAETELGSFFIHWNESNGANYYFWF